VSVPCVIAMPATSDFARISFTRFASFSHTSSFMSWLPMLAICSPLTSAISFISGTALIRMSTPTAPDWYPADVPEDAAPAIVPPVARMTTLGLAAPTAPVANSSATTSARTVPRAFIRTPLRLLSYVSTLLRVLRGIQVGQLDRVEQVLDLRFRQDLLLPDDLEDALAALVSFVRELGRLLVADDRVQGRDDADRGLHVVLEHLLVHGDPV